MFAFFSRLSTGLGLVSLLVAAPATAQYMYLDANGDGVNTSADVVNASGNTTLGIWLRTDSNRDGGAATCVTGENLTMTSYEFILRTGNGHMNWLSYTNLQDALPTGSGPTSSVTDYHIGFSGGVLPPGAYQLGTLEVSVAFGTPSLSIVSTTPLSGFFSTSFGSECVGQDFDNMIKLGVDWFDADGVAYGGPPQVAPVLASIADMTVTEGTVAEQEITATDADLQPLTFTKVSGPVWMAVVTTDPGSGTGHGRITLSPGFISFPGSGTGTVRVTDGIIPVEGSFEITVVNDPRPPAIIADTEVSLDAMTQLRPACRAIDPDGVEITVRLLSVPAYVSDHVFFSGSFGIGTANFAYWAKPGAIETGLGYLTIEASDESSSSRLQVHINVVGPPPAPAFPTDLFTRGFTATELNGAPSSLATGDFDGDGDADLVSATANGGLVEICRSDSKGGLTIEASLFSPEPRAVAAGDFDRDGLSDFAFVDVRTGEIAVVRGVAAGVPTVSQHARVGARPVALALGDVNRDGWLDAVVLDRVQAGVSAIVGSKVSVLLNDGAGVLGPPQEFADGPNGVALALGDFTGDSWLDAAVVRESPNALDILANSGAGEFLPATESRLLNAPPTGVVAGDIDRDGRSDLAITHVGFLFPLIILRSLGGGSFAAPLHIGNEYATPAFADLNRDGNLDFLCSDGPTGNSYVNVRFGNGAGAFSEREQIRGAYPLSSLAVGDVNADGEPDLVLGHGWGFITSPTDGTAAVFLNRGHGKFGSELSAGFRTATGNSVLADFNSDGHLDVAGGDGVNLGVGDGTFLPLIPCTPTADVQSGFRMAADINEDGHPDVLSARDGSNLIDLRIGDGSGQLVAPSLASLSSRLTTWPRLTLATGDFNEDGHLDLVVGSIFYDINGPGPMELWLGRGGGLFEAPTLLPGRAAATSLRVDDLDRDGHQDIIFLDFYYHRVGILTGNGDGTFDAERNLVEHNEYAGFDAMAWGDLNGDGLDDVVTSANSSYGALSIAMQRPGGSFTTARPIWTATYDFPASVELADLDGDSHLDVVTKFQGSIAIARGTGDGSVGLRRLIGPRYQGVLVGDMNEDGYPDLVSTWGYPVDQFPLRVFLNQSERLNRRAARAFVEGGGKTIPVGATGRDLCLRIEPVGGSYQNAELDPASIVMKSTGTGSVSQISAIPPKKPAPGDADGNGAAEVPACFRAADLAKLFSNVRGRQTVPVVIEGRVAAGGRMHAELALTIVQNGPSTSPTLSPNPLNPTGVFQFATTRTGTARILLFDVQGRLVRTVVDRVMPAGEHEAPFDGKDRVGRALASGVYYARIETADGTFRKRVAIVK